VGQSPSITAAKVSMGSIGAVGKYSVNHDIVVVEQSGSTAAGVRLEPVSICAVRKHSVSNEIWLWVNHLP
jgi:uncharacterized spore protein YtfJ